MISSYDDHCKSSSLMTVSSSSNTELSFLPTLSPTRWPRRTAASVLTRRISARAELLLGRDIGGRLPCNIYLCCSGSAVRMRKMMVIINEQNEERKTRVMRGAIDDDDDDNDEDEEEGNDREDVGDDDAAADDDDDMAVLVYGGIVLLMLSLLLCVHLAVMSCSDADGINDVMNDMALVDGKNEAMKDDSSVTGRGSMRVLVAVVVKSASMLCSF